MHSRSSENNLPDSGDPLAAVLSLLRPRTVLSKVISGAGRWSIRYGAQNNPGFALLLEGSCFLDVDGVGPVELREGDFVLLPATPGFTMASDLKLEPKLLQPNHPRELRHGSQVGPPSVRMLGGYFSFDRDNARLVLRLLPAMIHIRGSDRGATALRKLAELISDEATSDHPGRDLILQRLVEVMLVEAIRYRPAVTNERERGLLAGLTDTGLARPLRHMHADVARRWTVASLAKLAGMSRAVFAERFNRKVGMPPMQYLLEWRMALAKDMLRRERPPLSEVAERVGYQSASAFSTAFARLTGRPPSELARGLPQPPP